MKTQKQTIQELVSLVIDAINDGRLNDKPVSEIHHEVFNTYYFIIGRYKAEQWLIKNGGIFNAIGIVKEYEEQHLGELITDLNEPEKVCNMFVYILGEEVLNNLNIIRENWDENTTDEILQDLKIELESI